MLDQQPAETPKGNPPNKGPLPDTGTADWYDEQGEDRIETPDFGEIVFKNDETIKWRPTPNPRRLIEILQRERLIILAGSYPDKTSLARRCADEMAKLQSDLSSGATQVHARQLRASSRAEDVFSSVSDTQAPTVFVFPRIDPSKINRNIHALHEEIRDHHWVIISTDRTREAWQLSEQFYNIWLEPTETDLYVPGDLSRYLGETLSDQAKAFLARYGEPKEVYSNLAAHLGSPRAIEAFNRTLSAQDGADFDINDLLKRARNDGFAIETWFRYSLTPREQMIAIALSLFDGLEEDVAFAAIERLMERAWRRRDASLAFVDYGDLVNLRQYFAFDPQLTGAARLRAIGESTQATILETAWKTHRRQIGAALPELVQLVQASDDDLDLGIHLFRRDERLRALRESIGRSLGQVALLSLEEVEPHLLNLVASGRRYAHRTVAEALHHVRIRGSETLLFDMLSRWRTGGQLHRFLQALIGRNSKSSLDQLVGSAIATIIGQIALEDPLDDMRPEIIRLAQAYTNSGDTVIMKRLCLYTVPTLVNMHTNQMIDLAPEFLNRVGNNWLHSELLTYGFGLGFARALRAQQPGLVEELSGWIKDSLARGKKGVDEQRVSLREKQLAVAIHAISFARSGKSDRGSRGLSPADALALVTQILTVERHPFVRAASMTAIRNLIRNEYEGVASSLGGLLPHLTTAEVAKLVDIMVDLHCLQRSQQEGGDGLVRVGNYDCPIWYDKSPENTPIQNTVFAWVERAPSALAASFAGRAVLMIRTTIERSQEQERSRLIKQREDEEKRRKEIEGAATTELARHRLQLGFWDRYVVVPIATADKPSSATAVAGLLDTVKRLSRAEGEEVLSRIRQEGKKRANIANLTARAWWISRNLTRLLLLLAALAIFAIVRFFR